jgi:hypothetical protein
MWFVRTLYLGLLIKIKLFKTPFAPFLSYPFIKKKLDLRSEFQFTSFIFLADYKAVAEYDYSIDAYDTYGQRMKKAGIIIK